MRNSNQNDAKSISKLALLASAAATAALVISEVRVLRRMTTPAAAPAVPPAVPTAPISEAVDEVEPDDAMPSGSSRAEDSGNARGPEGDAPERRSAPPSGGARIRFRSRRPATERRHYGLPVSRRRPAAIGEARHGTAMTLLAAPTYEPGCSDDEEFDAEYLAIVEAITQDHPLDLEDAEYLAIVEAIVNDGRPSSHREAEAAIEVSPASGTQVDAEDLWWLPAPRLHYIFAALIYVAAAAAVGSDPVSLALEGVRALAAIDSTADLLLLGWVLCGMIVLVPLGAIAGGLLSLATRGRLDLPNVVSQDAIDSAGWGVRVLAVSAFVAGAVLYTPQALGWALNTDYPVAAVASSSMSPGLEEGELVLIEGVDSIDQLQVGHIIAFTHEQGIAVRRIAGFSEGAVIARADASPEQDLVVPFEDIAGRVLTVAGAQVKLPLLGSISLLGERTVEPVEPGRSLP